MKQIILIVAILIIPTLAFADAGIIVERTGKVTIESSAGTVEAKAGTEFPDGAIIKTDKESSAVLFFKNGAIKKLGGNKTFKAKGETKKADATIFAGLSAAAKDTSKKSRGPTAHMMVKKLEKPGFKTVNNKQLNSDLASINQLNLTPEATALLRGEVYYKYENYNDVIDALKTYCPPKKCKNDAAKS